MEKRELCAMFVQPKKLQKKKQEDKEKGTPREHAKRTIRMHECPYFFIIRKRQDVMNK